MAGTLETVSPNHWGKPSPWGSVNTTVPPSSFASVMDEQLAKDLQEKEDREVASVSVCASGEDTVACADSDLLLAQMLQFEYDLEHDLHVSAQEKHLNKNNKVAISLANFRSVHPALCDVSHEEQADGSSDSDDELAVTRRSPGSAGGKKKRTRRLHSRDGAAPTKHDAYICGRKNVCNMEKFLEASGDISNRKDDYTLSNSVYNSLKQHSTKEHKYSHKLHEKKEHSTQERTLDPKTRLIIFKLVDGGVLEEVNGCISTGKEANVYHAKGGSTDERSIPSDCAIKVFRTTLNEFKNRDAYIKNDFRFHGKINKHNPRKFIKLWAEKEKRNLMRLSKGGVPCPEVVLLRKHVLVMSFIGTNGEPAPTLQEAKLSPSQFKSAYDQCIKGMRQMYRECKLVHGDLSAFNMLWHEGRVYFIDVGQAVEPTHPASTEFLLRDCRHVTDFFSQRCSGGIMSPHELFTHVTDVKVTSECEEEFIAQVESYQSKEGLVFTKRDPSTYPFDYFFEKSSNDLDDTSSSSSISSDDD